MTHPAPISRRTFLAGASLALASPLATGCKRDPNHSATTVEFWTLALRPFEPYMRARFAEFEAANPGVTVRWIDVPYDALDRKLTAAVAAGRGPDLVNFSDKSFARYAALGAAADLSPLMNANAQAQYLEGALRIGRVEGALLALPWYLTTQSVLANTAVLEAGGLTPATIARRWTGLLTQAEAFHRQTGRQLFSVPLGAESDLPTMLLAEGLNPFTESSRGLSVDLLSEHIVAYVTRWVECFRAGVLPREAATHGSAHLPELYQNGRLGLMNSGPNFLKRIRDVAPGIFNQTHVGPPVTGALGRAHIAVMVLCVLSSSPRALLAAKLALHMTSPAAQEELCRSAVILPSTKRSLSLPMFAAPSGETQAPESRIALATATTARALRGAAAFTPALSRWTDMRRAFEEHIKRALLDGLAVPVALRSINREWQRILADSPGASIDAIPTPLPLTTPDGAN